MQIYCIQLSCDFHNKLLCLETFQVYLSNKSLSSPIQIFPILVEFIAKNTGIRSLSVARNEVLVICHELCALNFPVCAIKVCGFSTDSR